MKRMDRYDEMENSSKVSRSDKNKDLYQNVGRNTRYTNFSDVTNANAYDISNLDRNNKTRENYHKVREYSNLIPGPKVKRDLDEFKNIHKERENRVYDINSVMAEARKNRDIDEKEKKRKLKNDKYNILLSMTKEELEEYRKARKERYTHPDEEQLHELIDTIASKTLAGELDKNTTVNLLSELMATSIMDKVEKPHKEDEIEDSSEEIDKIIETEEKLKNTSPVKMEYENVQTEEELPEEVEESDDAIALEDDDNQDKSFVTDEKINPEQLRLLKEELDKRDSEKEKSEVEGADIEFYTKKMDIKIGDFEGEMDDEFKEKSLPILVKILIFLIIIAVIAVAGYYIYQMQVN